MWLKEQRVLRQSTGNYARLYNFSSRKSYLSLFILVVWPSQDARKEGGRWKAGLNQRDNSGRFSFFFDDLMLCNCCWRMNSNYFLLTFEDSRLL